MINSLNSPQSRIELLNKGDRNDILDWLRSVRPNVSWHDDERIANGMKPFDRETARQAMRKVILESSNGIIDSYMPKALDEDASPGDCRRWIELCCNTIGFGFSFDTPGSWFETDFGPCFSAESADSFDRSVEIVFQVLGETEPYRIGLTNFHEMAGGGIS